MRFSIEALLDYGFAEPADVLLALEAAEVPDQRVIDHSLQVNGGGPLTILAGGSNVGQRAWSHVEPGEMVATYKATVEVERALADLATLSRSPLSSLPGDVLPFIWPSRYCEADRLCSFVSSYFEGLDGGPLVQALSGWVQDNVRYVSGSSDGATTAVDTFVAQQGVCRDFAHLTAAFIRSQDIPARLVSVYAPQLDPPDFHAVVEVWLDGAWHLVDATGLAPVETMIRIAVGRDATDIAFMTAFGGLATMNSQSIRVFPA